MKRDSESGYALLVAVIGIAAFAYIAFQAIAANRGVIADADGDFTHARLSAATEAGLMIAIHGLGGQDPATSGGWSIDGRVRSLRYRGFTLNISVQDERGKVPLNGMNTDQVRALFAAAGARGSQLDTLTDSFDDWEDDDDTRRTNGAEAPDYAAQGISPRNGALRSVGELMSVKGIDAQIFQRLAPAVTVFFGDSGGFSANTSQPLALRAMTGATIGTPGELERERELAGERPSLNLASDDARLTGRPLTVQVTAQDGSGGVLTRSTIIELTGNSAVPYWIRERD